MLPTRHGRTVRVPRGRQEHRLQRGAPRSNPPHEIEEARSCAQRNVYPTPPTLSRICGLTWRDELSKTLSGMRNPFTSFFSMGSQCPTKPRNLTVVGYPARHIPHSLDNTSRHRAQTVFSCRYKVRREVPRRFRQSAAQAAVLAHAHRFAGRCVTCNTAPAPARLTFIGARTDAAAGGVPVAAAGARLIRARSAY